MTTKELFSLIKETFPEDFESLDSLSYSDLGFGFNKSDACKASLTIPFVGGIEYILVENDTQIIRIDRNKGNAMVVKNIVRGDVWVDAINKLSMEPVIRIKNPAGVFLKNGSIGIDTSSKSTVENKNDVVETPTGIHINPIQNHVLIYRAESKMSQAEIQAVQFPTKIDYENQTFFTPVEIFYALNSIPEVVDFLDNQGWRIWNHKICPIGLGSEGCIIENIITKQSLIVAVHIGPLVPKATIIFPDGTAITRKLYNLKPDIRPVTISQRPKGEKGDPGPSRPDFKESKPQIIFARSDEIKYDSKKSKIHFSKLLIDSDSEESEIRFSKLLIDFDPGTIVAI